MTSDDVEALREATLRKAIARSQTEPVVLYVPSDRWQRNVKKLAWHLVTEAGFDAEEALAGLSIVVASAFHSAESQACYADPSWAESIAWIRRINFEVARTERR